jgi:hypothetical protein
MSNLFKLLIENDDTNSSNLEDSTVPTYEEFISKPSRKDTKFKISNSRRSASSKGLFNSTESSSSTICLLTDDESSSENSDDETVANSPRTPPALRRIIHESPRVIFSNTKKPTVNNIEQLNSEFSFLKLNNPSDSLKSQNLLRTNLATKSSATKSLKTPSQFIDSSQEYVLHNNKTAQTSFSFDSDGEQVEDPVSVAAERRCSLRLRLSSSSTSSGSPPSFEFKTKKAPTDGENFLANTFYSPNSTHSKIQISSFVTQRKHSTAAAMSRNQRKDEMFDKRRSHNHRSGRRVSICADGLISNEMLNDVEQIDDTIFDMNENENDFKAGRLFNLTEDADEIEENQSIEVEDSNHSLKAVELCKIM